MTCISHQMGACILNLKKTNRTKPAIPIKWALVLELRRKTNETKPAFPIKWALEVVTFKLKSHSLKS